MATVNAGGPRSTLQTAISLRSREKQITDTTLMDWTLSTVQFVDGSFVRGRCIAWMHWRN